ncbi:MAG: hypothetical protein KAY06_02835 [Aeromonadaceae bacterium]|nr:hypothetical protein [Aeromonadaceae bacterium]
MSETLDAKKALAKLKRLAQELAGVMHDIVEETLWQEYAQLPALSQKLVAAVEKAEAFGQTHQL